MEEVRVRRHLAVVSPPPPPEPPAPRRVPCPRCGFVAASVPADGMVPAVMALAGEYRRLFADVAAGDREARLRERDSDSWSALERVVALADALHVRARAVRAIPDRDDERVHLLRIHAPRAGANEWPSQVVLAHLSSATADLGEAASRLPISAWDEPHAFSGRAGTVRELLVDALHEGRHTFAEIAALHLVPAVLRPA